MKYAHIFQTLEEQNAFILSNDYKEPFVGVVSQNDDYLVDYNKFYDSDITDRLPEIPLTIVVLSGGNFTIKSNNASLSKTIEYKKNEGAWTSVNITTATTTISVSVGDKLSFRGNNTTYSTGTGAFCNFGNSGTTTCKFVAYGNIMSLIAASNFSSLAQFTGTYALCNLFYNATGLKDASCLLLPSTVLTEGCYYGLFDHTAIKFPPKSLPSKNVATLSYSKMFSNNANLFEAPLIEGTYVQNSGCTGMFSNCGGLKAAPTLLFRTVGPNGCGNMFENCTKIEKLVAYISNPNTSGNTTGWLTGVSGSGLFSKLSETDTSLFPRNANGIPAGWEIYNMPSR